MKTSRFTDEQVYDAVEALGSGAAAALALGVSQATVSRKWRAHLEAAGLPYPPFVAAPLKAQRPRASRAAGESRENRPARQPSEPDPRGDQGSRPPPSEASTASRLREDKARDRREDLDAALAPLRAAQAAAAQVAAEQGRRLDVALEALNRLLAGQGAWRPSTLRIKDGGAHAADQRRAAGRPRRQRREEA